MAIRCVTAGESPTRSWPPSTQPTEPAAVPGGSPALIGRPQSELERKSHPAIRSTVGRGMSSRPHVLETRCLWHAACDVAMVHLTWSSRVKSLSLAYYPFQNACRSLRIIHRGSAGRIPAGECVSWLARHEGQHRMPRGRSSSSVSTEVFVRCQPGRHVDGRRGGIPGPRHQPVDANDSSSSMSRTWPRNSGDPNEGLQSTMSRAWSYWL